MEKSLQAGIKLINTLKHNGYYAYFIGGFVRDFLLKRPFKDIDIATSAIPQDVVRLFPSAKATGEKYGTVTVVIDEISFEVTTFRKEGPYHDYRHPAEVFFTDSLEADVLRRDFTINALAMTEQFTIIDYVHGQDDLSRGIIAAIGEPYQRFEEDALRILRALRFQSKLGFRLEPSTKAAISKAMPLLNQIANERILQEWKEIVEGDNALIAFQTLLDCGLPIVLHPLEKGLSVIVQNHNSLSSLAAFYAFCFWIDQKEIPSDWRFSNKQKALIETLITLADVIKDDTINVYLVYSYGLEVCLLANEMVRIIKPTHNQETRIRDMHHAMPIHKTCDLAFKGQDILKLNLVTDARLIGDIIDDITYQVISLQLPNTYDAIKTYVLNNIHSYQITE